MSAISSDDERRRGSPWSVETKKLTLMAVLAAVYALGSFLPGFPLLGVPGSKIDIVRSLEMAYGFILGPVYGPITAFLGAVVGKLMTGGGFGMYFTPLALVSSFTAACLMRKELLRVRGWMLSAGVLSALIVGWYILPTGRVVPLYPVLHFAALVIVVLLGGRIAEYLRSDDRGKLSIGVALSSYSSTMAGHMLGNLIFIVLLSPSPLFFMGILPVSAAERVVLTALSTVVATPLILILRSAYPELMEN
ncbi:MAG: hypothetical protein JSV27_07005 [Candidatus Bathyarchaeota archaeon]|nr:MAG: hypothetical protein JSV27_07005 [Candidatus Bathyarchaeota archaeon]